MDAVINCTMERVYGREIRSRSPWEVLAGWHEVELSKAAAKRAGRPGIALGVIENAVSELGELSGTSYGGASQNDWHHIAMISEFKTDYMALSKLVHLIRTGSIIHSFYNTIYGGSCGGRDGMTLAIVGGCILLQMLYMTNTHSVSPAHPFLDNDTTPEILQSISLAQQALAREQPSADRCGDHTRLGPWYSNAALRSGCDHDRIGRFGCMRINRTSLCCRDKPGACLGFGSALHRRGGARCCGYEPPGSRWHCSQAGRAVQTGDEYPPNRSTLRPGIRRCES